MISIVKKIVKITLIVTIIIIFACSIYNFILNRLYPDEFSEYVYEYSEKYNIEGAWIFALIKAESNFDPNIVSQSGAIGLMQLMENTATEVANDIGMKTVDLAEPKCNIEIGTKYFSTLLKYYNNNYYLAITAYNAGIGTVTKWIDNGIIKSDGSNIENIPYKETNTYVRKVLNNYKIYKELKNK